MSQYSNHDCPGSGDTNRQDILRKLNEVKHHLPEYLRVEAERMIAEGLPADEIENIVPDGKKYQVRMILENGNDVTIDKPQDTRKDVVELTTHIQKYAEETHPERTVAFYIAEVSNDM